MESDEGWLRTNELVEAVKGLRACRRHLAEGLTDAYELKWAALAVTIALQSFIVDTYRSVEIIGWDRRVLRRFEAWERGEGEPVTADDVHLPPFLALCEKLRDEKGWEPDAETWEQIERLGELRDQFMHFKPKGLAIEAEFLRAAIRAALAAIEYIIVQQPGDFRWDDPGLERAAHIELRAARRLTGEPASPSGSIAT